MFDNLKTCTLIVFTMFSDYVRQVFGEMDHYFLFNTNLYIHLKQNVLTNMQKSYCIHVLKLDSVRSRMLIAYFEINLFVGVFRQISICISLLYEG